MFWGTYGGAINSLGDDIEQQKIVNEWRAYTQELEAKLARMEECAKGWEDNADEARAIKDDWKTVALRRANGATEQQLKEEAKAVGHYRALLARKGR